MNDLPAQKGKKPSYIISTGGWSPKGVSGGNARMAMSVVYVVDANSGAFAAYGVPWVTGTASAMSKQAAKIQLLDVGKARSVDLRE